MRAAASQSRPMSQGRVGLSTPREPRPGDGELSSGAQTDGQRLAGLEVARPNRQLRMTNSLKELSEGVDIPHLAVNRLDDVLQLVREKAGRRGARRRSADVDLQVPMAPRCAYEAGPPIEARTRRHVIIEMHDDGRAHKSPKQTFERG